MRKGAPRTKHVEQPRKRYSKEIYILLKPCNWLKAGNGIWCLSPFFVTTSTHDLTFPLAPQCVAQIRIAHNYITIITCQVVPMPSLLVQLDALVIDRLFTFMTDVRLLIGQASDAGMEVRRLGLFDRIEILQVCKESVQSLDTSLLTFEFQCALQTNANEKLEVMSESCDQGQKLLGNAQFLDTSLLSL